MKPIRGTTVGIILCIAELITGILLLLNPMKFTSTVIVGVGIVLTLLGAIEVVKYFRTNAVDASFGQMLAKGLVSILTGIFCIFQWEWFLAAFPVLTIVYGIAILLIGIGKIQFTVDMLRLKSSGWIWSAVNAVLSIIFAVVILRSLFASTAVLWTFTGAVLVGVGIFDLVVLILFKSWKGA